MTDSHPRFEQQASQYQFPYHWLPGAEEGAWTLGRSLFWGHEYLGVLEVMRSRALTTNPVRILDFGCGDGRLALEMAADSDVEVLGIDLAKQAIAFAEAFAYDRPNCSFQSVKVDQLDEYDFDAITAMEVLEHIPDADMSSVVGSLRERCDRDGRLIISVPTVNRPVISKHFRHYTFDLLRDHLDGFFQIESFTYVHRLGIIEGSLRRVWTNRFFDLRHSGLAEILTRAYKKYCHLASEHDGAHLVVTARPFG